MTRRTIARSVPCRGVAWAIALAALCSLATSALSVAQTPGASEPTTRVLRPSDEPPLAPQVPADNAPSAPERTSPVPPLIALVLPLESPTYGRAAEAVRAGFAAAAESIGERFTLIPHGNDDVAAAFERARDAGAGVVVGPLVRDDLKALVSAGFELPWTIALNQLDDGAPLPDRVYTLALSTESDGRQLAQRARRAGAQTATLVVSDSPLQKRFANAFTAEWILQGGPPPSSYRFDRAPEVLSLLRRELSKAQPDAVLLALDAADVLLVKPFVGQRTIYTSSLVNERQSRTERNDLEGVMFVDIPWLVDPNAAVFAKLPRKSFNNVSLDRL